MGARFFSRHEYLCLHLRPAYSQKKASQLVRHAAGRGEGIVSYQVVQEFFNVALDRFAQPMSVAEADFCLPSLLAVHSSPTLYFEALRIAGKHRVSWYDALIVAAAIEGQCAILYSQDFSYGQVIDSVRIQNPFV